MIDTTVKSGKPFLPVSDAQALIIGSAAGTGVSQQETWVPSHKTTLNFNNVVVPIVDTGGANGGQGSLKIYDWPEGAIILMGALYNLTISRVGTNIAANAAVVGALGTVAPGVGDAALTGTEANIIPSTSGTLVSGAGVLKGFNAAPAAPFDGTTTPSDILLNLAIPDAGIAGNDSILVNGTVVIAWTDIGDY